MHTRHPLPRAICGHTDQQDWPAPAHLLEKGTSDVTVILLLLLSMVTTPPPRFPALPFTLIRSCRNCSCRRNTAVSWGHNSSQTQPPRLACACCSGAEEQTLVSP